MHKRVMIGAFILVGICASVRSSDQNLANVLDQNSATLFRWSDRELDQLITVDTEIEGTIQDIRSIEKTEYPNALQHVRYEYVQYKAAEAAMLRHLATSISTTLSEAINKPEYSGLVQEQSSATSLLINFLCGRIVIRSYIDLKAATIENWRRLYNLLSFFLNDYPRASPKLSVDIISQFKSYAEYIWGEMEQLEGMSNRYSLHYNGEVREVSKLFPEDYPMYNQYLKLKSLIDEINESTKSVRAPLASTKALKIMVQQQLPEALVKRIESLGQKLKSARLSWSPEYQYGDGNDSEITAQSFEDLILRFDADDDMRWRHGNVTERWMPKFLKKLLNNRQIRN